MKLVYRCYEIMIKKTKINLVYTFFFTDGQMLNNPKDQLIQRNEEYCNNKRKLEGFYLNRAESNNISKHSCLVFIF